MMSIRARGAIKRLNYPSIGCTKEKGRTYLEDWSCVLHDV